MRSLDIPSFTLYPSIFIRFFKPMPFHDIPVDPPPPPHTHHTLTHTHTPGTVPHGTTVEVERDGTNGQVVFFNPQAEATDAFANAAIDGFSNPELLARVAAAGGNSANASDSDADA